MIFNLNSHGALQLISPLEMSRIIALCRLKMILFGQLVYLEQLKRLQKVSSMYVFALCLYLCAVERLFAENAFLFYYFYLILRSLSFFS